MDERDGASTDVPSRAAVALPLFRSAAQFAIVGELFATPGVQYTIGELAERTGAPQATVSREVARLGEAGLVTRRSEGNRTLVSADGDALIADEVTSITRKLYGPVAALRERLADVHGIERAFIFGSFARRWSGEGGPLPRDVDVLVIGEVEPDVVWGIAADLSRDLGIEINPVLRTVQEWQDERTGFAAAVQEGPKIHLVGGPSAGDGRG